MYNSHKNSHILIKIYKQNSKKIKIYYKNIRFQEEIFPSRNFITGTSSQKSENSENLSENLSIFFQNFQFFYLENDHEDKNKIKIIDHFEINENKN